MGDQKEPTSDPRSAGEGGEKSPGNPCEKDTPTHKAVPSPVPVSVEEWAGRHLPTPSGVSEFPFPSPYSETMGLPSPTRSPADPTAYPASAAVSPFALQLKGWDRYQIEELLGEGGMAQVYKAFDPQLKRHVALKFLKGGEPQWDNRFLQEAQAQAQVDHEHVCKVYEVGLYEGRPYIAMQYVAGKTLGDAAREMVLEQKVKVMKQVAEAVHAAHRLGLIHRDLKPSNILVERTEEGEWRPYVTDFGLAKEQAAPQLTIPGNIMGTPAYMAPEQVRGDMGQLDRRTDVFSLGVTLYELLVGSLPFEGATIDILVKVMETEPEPLRKRLPSLPADLETIVLKCMEKEPQRRYDSARALAEDLGRFLEGEPVQARPTGLLYKLGKKARRHKVAVSLSSVALLAIVALLGMWWQARHSAAKTAEMAQAFGQEVERMESVLRLAFLAPLHDTRKERAQVRQRMEAVRAQVSRVGKLAEGPGYYALGRGHLALGEPEKAKEALEKAWQSGYRAPQEAYALGQAMGLLYQKGLSDLRRLEDEDLRAAKRKELERNLRDPALAYLKQSTGIQVESPAYVEGLIAFYEGRSEYALLKAREAAGSFPWLYEARRLEGDAHMQVGESRWARGDEAGALSAFSRAGEAYGAAVAVGRSDATLYERDGERWLETFDLLRLRKGSPKDAFEKANAALDLALQADPASARACLKKSSAYATWAEERLLRGDAAEEELGKAAEFAQKAIACDPQEAEAYYQLGLANELRGSYDTESVSDSLASVERAAENYEKAAKLAPGFAETYMGLGNAHMAEGRLLAQKGQDPRPTLRAAIEAYKEAVRLLPATAEDLNDQGSAYRRMADYEMRHDLDPRPSLEKSIESYRKALELKPQNPVILSNLGNVYECKGEFEADRGLDPSAPLELAVSAFQKSIALKPDFAFARNNLGNAYYTQAAWDLGKGKDPRGWLARAKESYKAALEVNPSYCFACNNLGNAHLLEAEHAQALGGDPVPSWSEALASFQRAVKINPEYGNAYRNMGWLKVEEARALEEKGRSPSACLMEARNYLKRAEAINPNDAEICLREGEADRVEADWAMRHGASPESSLEACARSFSKAEKLNGRDARIFDAEAQMYARRAMWLASSRQDPAQVIQRGMDAASKALSLEAGWARAMVTRARLLLEKSTFATGSDVKRENAQQAAAELKKALAINANLNREVQPLLAEASRLAAKP